MIRLTRTHELASGWLFYKILTSQARRTDDFFGANEKNQGTLLCLVRDIALFTT